MRLLLSTIIITMYGAFAAADDPSLLPTDGELRGLARSGRTKTFTASGLYGYIDGGAELFLEFGFDSLTIQKFRAGTEDEFIVEIYRMSDPTAALGIYLMKCGAEIREESLTARHTINRYQLLLTRGNYLVSIVHNGKERSREHLLRLAGYISGKIAPSPPPSEMDLLPAGNVLPGSIRLLRGKYALQSIITLGEGNILQLGGAITAVAADVVGEKDTSTVILTRYTDPEIAATVFRSLEKSLDRAIDVIGLTHDTMTFRDYSGRFGTIHLTEAVIRIRLNADARAN